MFDTILGSLTTSLWVVVAMGLVGLVLLFSIHRIGPTEVGLVIKRFSWSKLSDGNVIAFNGEAGYQADLLMPGLRFKLWPMYGVDKRPLVQVPAGQIGVVIAQVGSAPPTGAKSVEYKQQFGNFSDLGVFVRQGGQKGIQRPVLPGGTVGPIHPIGFLVITADRIYGEPINDELRRQSKGDELTCQAWGLERKDLTVTRIGAERGIDMVGVVTALDGPPLEPGQIASRLGGFDDIRAEENSVANDTPENVRTADQRLIELVLGNNNTQHNNYQDFQAFLTAGGRIGRQHDPLLPGAYNLNPFLVKVELVPMVVVEQGQVAVIKSYVGLPTEDTSGAEFKHGSLVRPGHRGLWQEPLRTGKYALNPHIYEIVMVPTFILTLNWGEANSKAHNLDKGLSTIAAKSQEGFEFSIDLQVQIHVSDVMAPRVISRVGSMENLINEVLQAAVGNYFRDTLQGMPAVRFIQERSKVQIEAQAYITGHLKRYDVETPGAYIQDIVLPVNLVAVLQQREIANQEIETFKKRKEAEDERVSMEAAKGTADMQKELAASQVSIKINENKAQARMKEAEGEASYLTQVGRARAVETEAKGLALAAGLKAQQDAVGKEGTTLVNVVSQLAQGGNRFVPEILIVGGEGGGIIGGVGAQLMKLLGDVNSSSTDGKEKEA
ncbi:MAG TPA: SPFH domain-containing protein [Thermoanaerobaculia bacterium]|jgi:hypothetical protein|nr:SPFH domain-containing protein [Thermoanaerobaculia bacterium]